MNEIWLTNIPEKLKALLEERYDEIDSFINNKTPRGLLVATERIIDLQARGIGKKKTLDDFLTRIDGHLAEYSRKAVDWWVDYSPLLYKDNDPRYDVLRYVMSNLTVENYRNVRDRRMRSILTEAVVAAAKGEDCKSVATLLRDAKPAARIASADVLEASGATIRSAPGSAGHTG
jgi:hypothetical protein